MSTANLFSELQTLVDSPPDQYWSLPPAVFNSRELFALETEHLFRRGWVLIGRVDQVPEPGDYLCVDVLEEPLVVSRDRRGELHVLSRVCRHRCMEICQGRGHARVFVCPYHAWTYDLDGRLKGAPEMQDTPGFDISTVHLPELKSEIWQGFIFVNISGDAPPLGDTLSLAREQLLGYHLESWRTVRSVDFGESPWDWKVFMDNGEIYHHLGLHRETVEPRSPASLTENGDDNGEFSLIYGPAAPDILVEADDGKPVMPAYLSQDGNWTPSSLTDQQRTSAAYFYPFPNYVIALWVNFGIFFRVMPLAAGRCHIYADYMVPGEFVDHPGLGEALETASERFAVVQDEDAMACAGVQRGTGSRFATATRLSRLEHHNHTFARWFARKITQAPDANLNL